MRRAVARGGGARERGREWSSVRNLKRQPSWSDLPLILITAARRNRPGPPAPSGRVESPVGNISIIERPVRPETLVSTCEVALRSRRRQYQVRDLLNELDEADRRKDEFLAMLAHELRNPLAAVANARTSLTQARTPRPITSGPQESSPAKAASWRI